MPNQPACGQMIASKAVVPQRLSAGASALADMLDAHAKVMSTNKDKASQAEVKGPRELAKSYRQVATDYDKATDELKKAASRSRASDSRTRRPPLDANIGQGKRQSWKIQGLGSGMPVALAQPMPIPLRALIGLPLFSLVLLVPQVQAGWSLAIPGRVTRVVSAGDHVAAIRGQTVLLLRDDGSSVGQLSSPETESRRKLSRSDGRAREDLLDFLGIDESEQDSSWVEDELNNESTLMQRRLRREGRKHKGTLVTGRPAIAAAVHDLWIGNAQGLWCWPATGDLIHVAHDGFPDPHLAALPDGRVLLASGSQIWLFASDNEARRLLATSESVHHITASASTGSLAWTKGNQIEQRTSLDSPGQVVTVNQSVRDLQYCGESLLLLSQDGLTTLTPEGVPIPLAPRLAARRLACGDGLAPWLAIGPDLMMSADQGHTWTSITIPTSARIFDAAVGRDCLWVATEKGLYRLSDQTSVDDWGPAVFTSPPGLALGPRLAPWWAALLPQLTVAGGALLARGRRDIQTVALASFPLDSPTPRTSFRLVADNTDVTAPHENRGVELTVPPDPDADCLTLARTKAVSLAMVEPDRARSYVDRARHAAWLPELRMRVDRRFGRSESLDVPSTSTSTTSPLGVDTVDDVRYEARVTWDLARLVFSNDELAAQAQSMHMAEMRRDIEVTVSRLYFERRRLRLERLSAGATERTVRRELRVREIEAELDTLSGGGFSQCIAGRTTGQGDS